MDDLVWMLCCGLSQVSYLLWIILGGLPGVGHPHPCPPMHLCTLTYPLPGVCFSPIYAPRCFSPPPSPIRVFNPRELFPPASPALLSPVPFPPACPALLSPVPSPRFLSLLHIPHPPIIRQAPDPWHAACTPFSVIFFFFFSLQVVVVSFK